jgi:hypothetical protein
MIARRTRFLAASRTLIAWLPDGQTTFTLRNISLHGAAGVMDRTLAEGTRIVIEFESGASAVGYVRWCRDGIVGIFFPQALDPSCFVAGEARVQAPREPRFNTSRVARLHVGDSIRPCMICNVSTRGARLETGMALQVFHSIAIEYGTMTVGAQVRWSTGVFAGVRFERPIDLDEFERSSIPAPPLG